MTLERTPRLIEEERSKAIPTDISLDDWVRIRSKRLSWDQAVEVVAELADQLSTTHDTPGCQGTICPETIRLISSANEPTAHGKWILAGAGPKQSASNEVVTGEDRCRAPELLATDRTSDPQCNVYSLGIVLYWLLCHRYPFRSLDREELQREIVEDAPQPPRQIVPGIPLELERLCLRMLAKDPALRPSHGTELARALRHVLETTETHGTTTRLGGLTLATNENQLHLVFTWCSTQPLPQFQQLFCERIEQQHGQLVRQTESVTVAHLARIRNLPAGMPTFLHHALMVLVGLRKDVSEIEFSIDSAVTADLKRRARRLSGRITARGLEVTRQSLEVIRRWLPCKELAEQSDQQFEVTTEPDVQLRFSVCGEDNDYGSASRPTFVGRSAQLALLKSRWVQSLEGKGQIVVLIGEEGLGKTRLIQELQSCLIDSVHESSWVIWNCRQVTFGPNPNPAVAYFQESSDESNLSMSKEERNELVTLQPRDRWQQALIKWLKRMASESPVVFVVEDLQWVDPDTLAFQQKLVDLELHDRILTILTCRPEFETPWGSRPHQTQIALNRLTKRHTASIFATTAHTTDPSPSELERLMEFSDGIPLFIEGFAKAWK